jgi:2-polyprenyl-3-methyl-5-hydroxy-6-metoxy-1,4-benzoquinol methylase
MDSQKLISALRIIRKELLIKDEPLKAYYFLKEVNIPELKPELEKTYGMVRHLFEPEVYEKTYGDDTCVNYDPEQATLKAELCYLRYGWLLKCLEEEKAKTFLDLGCFVGTLVLTASSRGYKAYGVDYTKRAINIAKERATKFKLDAEFFVDNAETFTGVKADAVSAFEIIEHVSDPLKFAEHLCSLTNEGGWVHISTPNGAVGRGEGNFHHWEYDGKNVRGHVRVFTMNSLRKMLEGYEIGYLKVEEEGVRRGVEDGLLYCKFRKKVTP